MRHEWFDTMALGTVFVLSVAEQVTGLGFHHPRWSGPALLIAIVSGLFLVAVHWPDRWCRGDDATDGRSDRNASTGLVDHLH